MKQLFLMLILVTNVTIAQSIDIGLGQDPTLALFKDKHKNKPFTPDIIFLVSFNGRGEHSINDKWYFSMDFDFEYAELYDGIYKKYLISSKWTNKEYQTPKIWFIDSIDLELGIAGGIGIIQRWGIGMLAYGVTGEINFKNNTNLKPFIRSQIVNAPDLINKDFRFSVYLGIKYNVNLY